MKARWLLATVAAAPFVVAVLALQSCGGEGGPIGGGGGTGGDTALVAQFKALWTDSQKTATYVGSAACGAAGCHGTLGPGEDIYGTWHDTKHFGKNVGCESCHGPGSAHAASHLSADILTFPKVVNPIVCGQCHGPIYNDYLNSKHRQLVPDPVEAAPSTQRSSRCIACHSNLFRTKIYEKGVDPTTLTDQEITDLTEETLNDVPFTAACATCHNPHAQTANLNKDGKEVQLRHKVFNDDPTDIMPGTVANTFTHFDHTCAECHNGRGADGRDAKLISSTSRPNMHDSPQYNMLMGVGGSEDAGGPAIRNMAHSQTTGQCSHCHMPDSRHTFTVSYDKGCSPCHSPADAAARKAALAVEITQSLFALRTRMQNWALAHYNQGTAGYNNVPVPLFPFLWDYSSNISAAATELGYDVNAIPSPLPPGTHQAGLPIELKRARHNYYFIVKDHSTCPHNPPYARYLIDYANAQMHILDGLDPMFKPMKFPSFNEMQRIIQSDNARSKRADLEALNDGGD